MEHQAGMNNLGQDEEIFEELKNFNNIKMDVIPRKIFYSELKHAFFVAITILFVINFLTTFVGVNLTAWASEGESLLMRIWTAFILSLIFTIFQFIFFTVFGCIDYVYFKKGLLQHFKHGKEILARYHQFLKFAIKFYLVVTAVISVFFICVGFPEAILYAPQIFGYSITLISCSVILHIELNRLGIPHALEGIKKAFGISGARGGRGGYQSSSSFNPNASDIPKSRQDDMSQRSDDYSAPNHQSDFNNNQNDHFSNSFSSPSSSTRDDFSTSFNPATGLPMTGGGVDIGGNPSGTGEKYE